LALAYLVPVQELLFHVAARIDLAGIDQVFNQQGFSSLVMVQILPAKEWLRIGPSLEAPCSFKFTVLDIFTPPQQMLQEHLSWRYVAVIRGGPRR
jgi:hypothetical protein